MNILITGGFSGAGKTTFINYFLNRVSGPGRLGTAVLVNEFGEIPVDTVLIEKGGLSIREVTGSWLTPGESCLPGRVR
jgi:G3E family GTPase